MNLLIVGANSFFGKNLKERIIQKGEHNLLLFSHCQERELLEDYLRNCDFMFHFAAMHRPLNSEEFYKVNDEYLSNILEYLRKIKNNCPIVLTSSIQATDNTDYGRSKMLAEQLLRDHAKITNSNAIIYRLTNTFGKWAKPNNNSVVATFCYNINHNIPIMISDAERVMNFCYIDDIMDLFEKQIEDINSVEADVDGFFRVNEEKIINISLGELAKKLYSFKECQDTGRKPILSTRTDYCFWDTYQSYSNENYN